jgi:hypothetical protein
MTIILEGVILGLVAFFVGWCIGWYERGKCEDRWEKHRNYQ